ncbi:phytanoyl-CoA dioxygenase family protein [Jeongeupia wiesaeckerbachi]|uniref:phytanoyl-CoA dioxygenase family protein n=1 Tax=Jeongeupia wiesaeckerbachi TaxID=3051218 RepID=UPI003D8034E1
MSLARDGYALVRKVLAAGDIAAALVQLDAMPATGAGSRNLLDTAWCRTLATHLKTHPAIAAALPAAAVAIQCTYFEKSTERNWLVPLHQDLAVPAGARVDHPELGVWSEKQGQVFVQAPPSLLQDLLAVRVHLDPCAAEHGPLRVVAGSHRHGRLHDTAIADLRANTGEVACVAEAGAALLMRPLLLHASSKATRPNRRRVLHFLFAPPRPGYGLSWPHAV